MGEQLVLQRELLDNSTYIIAGRMKEALLALVIVTLLFSVAVGVYAADSIPKPSIPEFTLKLVDHSYDVEPLYSFDPYTGKNMTSHASYHVENKSIEVWIKNQHISQYSDEKGNVIRTYYNIRAKGHFEDWKWALSPNEYLTPTGSEFTIVTFGFGEENSPYSYKFWLGSIANGGQIDFQVEALSGYYTRIYGTPQPPVPGIPGYHPDATPYIPFNDVFTGEESGWSNTQTITIPEASPAPMPTSSSPLPTFSLSPFVTQQTQPEPTQTNLLPYIFVAIAAVIIGFVAGILVTKFRHNKPKA